MLLNTIITNTSSYPYPLFVIMIQEEKNTNTRKANEIEQFIIERVIRNIRILHIELLIVLGSLDLILWYFAFLFFTESIIIGLIQLLLALVVGLFTFSIWDVVKNAKIKSYSIHADQGEWKIEQEGTTAKTTHYISKINEKKVAMITPGMADMPKYGHPKHITYEYITLLESPPPFGHNHVFISIENKKLTEKHKIYIQRIKPIGVLSIISCATFCVLIVFCFMIEFDNSLLSYFCLGLFMIFLRTLWRWNHNTKLRKKLLA